MPKMEEDKRQQRTLKKKHQKEWLEISGTSFYYNIVNKIKKTLVRSPRSSFSRSISVNILFEKFFIKNS